MLARRLYSFWANTKLRVGNNMESRTICNLSRKLLYVAAVHQIHQDARAEPRYFIKEGKILRNPFVRLDNIKDKIVLVFYSL